MTSICVLQPGLLQGIDYYIVNSTVWHYLARRYDYFYALLVRDGPSSPPRLRSPCHSSAPTDEELLHKSSLPSRSPSRIAVVMPPSDAPSPPSIPDQFLHAPHCALRVRIPCVVCGEDALLRCRRCQRVFYCSFACRSAHFTFHRYACSAPRAPREADTQPMLPAERAVRDLPAGTDQVRQGIANAGNTCYLSAGLQCLFSVAPLRRLLLSRQFERYLRSEVGSRGGRDG